jgi:nucleoside-diphosphate-sugar epimerase
VRVLITGGTGFIGSRLALRCLAEGHAVAVLGQENTDAEAANRQYLEAQGADVIAASVTDRERMFAVMPGIELVYHLAAAQHEANVPDQHFWEVNVTGTQNLLDASVKSGVKRFIHGSTIGVYGSASSGIIDEQTPRQPDNIYGETKLEGEQRVLLQRDHLPVVIVRISETYGPGDYRLLKLFKAIQKRVFLMIGHGQNIHHLIYIDDLVAGLTLAATMVDAVGETFVLAGKETLTTDEMVATIAAQLGTHIPKWRAPLPLLQAVATVMEKSLPPLGIQPPLHRRRLDFFRKSFVMSPAKACNLLGFAPQWHFRDGVRATAQWYAETGSLTCGS